MSNAPRVVIDTSVAVPALLVSHPAHAAVRLALRDRTSVLAAHSLAETYSVLTRLPGDARGLPGDVARVIADNFSQVVPLRLETQVSVHYVLADAGISGGAVYDGLVALAALDSGLPVASRDTRARSTYAALGAAVILITD